MRTLNRHLLYFLLLGAGTIVPGARSQDNGAVGVSPAVQVKPSNGDPAIITSTQPRSGADPGTFPALTPMGRPSIGLVLEGGGALGLAHIGVLRWLEENHIPVDRLTGTSMGSFVGALYASGKSVDEIETMALGSANVFMLQAPYSDVSFRRREDRKDLPQAITFDLNGGIGLRNAVLSDTGLNELLREQFNAYNNEGVSFDRLPIPFRCVATDLNSLAPVVFSKGSMAQAVRASISIPGIFPPVKYNDHYLVDGAIVDNLPTDIAKTELHSEVVIAVHLATSDFVESDVHSILGIFSRAYGAGTARTENNGKLLANILIVAETQKFAPTDYDKGRQLIEIGYSGTEQRRSDLIRYRVSDEAWNAYLTARKARVRKSPGALKIVKVEGGTPAANDAARRDLEPLQGKPIDAKAVSESLRRVEGNGGYTASFETISALAPRASDKTAGQSPDDGVVVHLHEADGHAILMAGADITAATSNVTRMSLDFRIINRDFGGFGSELRTDVRVGFLTQFATEYYRQLASTSFFLQPHLGILREPVYLWANQERISERLEQQAGGGLDFGKTFSRNLQIAAQWRMQNIRWMLTTGQDQSTSFSGTVKTAALHLTYDTAVAGAVSPRGLRVDFTGGYLLHTSAVRSTPILKLKTSQTFTYRQKNLFGIGTEVESHFHNDVPDPLRFTLGGPLRLSASSIDEYRGTDVYLARAGYLRRIAVLPIGFGQGVYATVAYEVGDAWSAQTHTSLRQDGLAGVVAATPFGVITVAGSVGDAGRRKIFFSLGRLF
jgi:NTE family protein